MTIDPQHDDLHVQGAVHIDRLWLVGRLAPAPTGFAADAPLDCSGGGTLGTGSSAAQRVLDPQLLPSTGVIRVVWHPRLAGPAMPWWRGVLQYGSAFHATSSAPADRGPAACHRWHQPGNMGILTSCAARIVNDRKTAWTATRRISDRTQRGHGIEIHQRTRRSRRGKRRGRRAWLA